MASLSSSYLGFPSAGITGIRYPSNSEVTFLLLEYYKDNVIWLETPAVLMNSPCQMQSLPTSLIFLLHNLHFIFLHGVVEGFLN